MLKGQISIWDLLDGITEGTNRVITVNSFDKELTVTGLTRVHYNNLVISVDSIRFEKEVTGSMYSMNIILILNDKFLGVICVKKNEKVLISPILDFDKSCIKIVMEVI